MFNFKSQKIKKFIFFTLLILFSSNLLLASEKSKNTQASSTEASEDKESSKVSSDSAAHPYNPRDENFKYINSWIAMRPVQGKSLYDGNPTEISSEPGVSYLIFFISSWCSTCKTKIQDLKKLQDTHSKLYTKVIYAFSHDTYEDALNFSKKHDIQKDSVLVDDPTLAAYSNPHIPSVFVVDRNTWIIDAYQSLDQENLRDIDEILNLINSY